MSFDDEVRQRIAANAKDAALCEAASKFMHASTQPRYSYNFAWMGRPVIQYPQDIVAMHEIIWRTQPDLIIETGIAHGGSLIFSASMLELNAVCGGPANARVLGIDIDIRAHNRAAIEAHPMARRIHMMQGSSIAAETIAAVRQFAAGSRNILVCLDSNHTHDHVLAELEAYAPLTSVGNYCVVFDTVVEDLPGQKWADRPWGPGNNPKTAVWKYLETHPQFQIDKSVHQKLLITVAPDGYLLRVK
jgi:cephalosporin hydroxylase